MVHKPTPRTVRPVVWHIVVAVNWKAIVIFPDVVAELANLFSVPKFVNKAEHFVPPLLADAFPHAPCYLNNRV